MRSLSHRDALLVLLGAACMHIASLILTPFSLSSIVVNTQVNSHSDFQDNELYEIRHPAPLELPNVNAAAGATGEYLPPLPSLDSDSNPFNVGSHSPSLQLDIDTTIPETALVSHAPGWTVFRNLYMSDGALFIVTSTPDLFPDISLMTSTGLPAENTPESIQARMPTDRDMRIITPAEAWARWGAESKEEGQRRTAEKNRLFAVRGSTLLFNDPPQFLDHYYHFCAELFFGVQAFWTGAFNARITLPSSNSDSNSPNSAAAVHSTAPSLDRAIFTHTRSQDWRDKPGFNAYFLRAAFPSLTVETEEDWIDRINTTTPFRPTPLPPSDSNDADAGAGADGKKVQKDRAWWFDAVLLTDRSAAFRGQECGSRTQRTASEAFLGVQPTLDRNWWEPVRRAVLRFAGIEESVLGIGQRVERRLVEGVSLDRIFGGSVREQDRGVEGGSGSTLEGLSQDEDKIVVSYIDRQGSRRHLIQEDHERLVEALKEVCGRRGWELNVVQAEKLTKEEQLEVVARTTFMLGVHGNGLTHLIMMPPTPLSTVIEIFYPAGFAHDYEWTARARGFKHFAVWNDTYASYPDERVKDPNYPEGFQGTSIPVSGEAVVRILEGRADGVL